jgi:hypothetical protein
MNDVRHQEQHIGAEGGPDALCRTILDNGVLALAAGTVAYWTVLVTASPVYVIYPLLLIIFSVLKKVFFFKKIKVTADADSGALIALALLAGWLGVSVNIPNSDDIAFFHRAKFAAENLGAPLALYDTSLDSFTELPNLTGYHYLTSIEVVVALIARAAGISPIYVLHLVVPIFFNGLLVFSAYLLFRYLGLSVRGSVVGTSFALLYLLLSLQNPADWGRYTLLRAWQGKSIAVGFGVWALIVACFEYKNHPTAKNLMFVGLVSISLVGLSSTGLVLVPCVVCSFALAWVVSNFRNTKELISVGSLFLILCVPIGCYFYATSFIFQSNLSWFFSAGWPTDAIKSFLYVYSGKALAFSLLNVLFFIAIRQVLTENSRIFLTYTLLTLLLFAPILGDIALTKIPPGVYWRLAYAVPVPIIFGLVMAIFSLAASRWKSYRYFVIVVVGAALLVSWRDLKLYATQSVGLKFDLEVRQDLPKLVSIVPRDAVILGQESVAIAVALTAPSVRLAVGRIGETQASFAAVSRVDEGAVRGRASAALSRCEFDGGEITLGRVLPNVNVVVIQKKCDEDAAKKYFGLNDGRWRRSVLKNYNVFVRDSRPRARL